MIQIGRFYLLMQDVLWLVVNALGLSSNKMITNVTEPCLTYLNIPKEILEHLVTGNKVKKMMKIAKDESSQFALPKMKD
jgi:hypothetical protein